MAEDPKTEWEKKNPGKELPKGLAKGIERAKKANATGDKEAEKAVGKSPGKLNLRVLRGSNSTRRGKK